MLKQKRWEDFPFGNRVNKHLHLSLNELNYKTWKECMNSYLKTLRSKYYRQIWEEHQNSKYHCTCCKFTIFSV